MRPTACCRAQRRATLLAACLLPLAAAAQPAGDGAQQPPPAAGVEPAAGAGLTYALGLALVDTPTYAGATSREQKLRPLWALRYGRLRLSGARSSGLLGAATAERRSGASIDLFDNPNWSLGLGLRFDNGRKPGDDPVLAGLPEIRSTLRARLNSNWTLGRGFSTSLSYATDLLGRDGGAQLSWGLGYGWAPWPAATASVGVGATWADRQHMQTYFGVAPDVALRAGRTAFTAGGGLMDLNAGMTLQVRLRGRWMLLGSLTMSELQGAAAASPLTRQPFGASASLALAWRSQ